MNLFKFSSQLCNIGHLSKNNLTRFFSTTSISSSSLQSTEKQNVPTKEAPKNFKDEGEEFRHLLRHSLFINIGDPENKVVRGKVFHVVNDDLYIDFGWKFHCVCPRPPKNGELFMRGTEVLLRIKQLELSSKFLGSDKGLTLLEAECSIIKLISTPIKQNIEDSMKQNNKGPES